MRDTIGEAEGEHPAIAESAPDFEIGQCLENRLSSLVVARDISRSATMREEACPR